MVELGSKGHGGEVGSGAGRQEVGGRLGKAMGVGFCFHFIPNFSRGVTFL